MKIPSSLHLLTMAAALAATPAFAQSSGMLSSDETGGLLGQTYSGVEIGYTHHIESAPRTLHRYSFVSNKPMDELGTNTDAAFRYDYMRGGEAGRRFDEHNLNVSFVRYLTQGEVKPFGHIDVGYLWQKAGPNREESFVYRVGLGVEFKLKPRVALVPYFNYRDARQVEESSFQFGARVVVRPDRRWSWSFSLQADDEHNIEYAAGAQRRF
ncbi:MAG TPA: hypothetical protein VM029_01405 [Opitutaceae bacterium]|nr:hypothetical protein [Opitutaceae bacterium]